MDRQEITNKAISLFDKNPYIILNWGTGVGKSAAAIKLLQHSNPSKILLLVAETPHKKNWQEEFNKWGPEIEKRVTIECYASLKKYTDTTWDVIVLDEGHHSNSDLRLECLSSITTSSVIVLSATLPIEVESNLSRVFKHTFTKYSIPLQQAIELGILPKPYIYLVPLTLQQGEYTETIQESWGKGKKIPIIAPFERSYFYLGRKHRFPSVDLTISCNQFQKYNYLTNKLEHFKRQYLMTRKEYLKNKWLQYGSLRKRVLAEFKTPLLKQLLEKVKNKKYICFCGSIEQAEILDKDHAIHSKNPLSFKLIDQFNTGEVSHLLAVNMLQEGQNLSNIELGIIAQLDGQERAFIQKFGRSLRAETPVQIILYFKNTRDEEYLDKALESIDPAYVQEVENIFEIFN